MAFGVGWRPCIWNWPGLPLSLEMIWEFHSERKDDRGWFCLYNRLNFTCKISRRVSRPGVSTLLMYTWLPCVCERGADCSPCHGLPRMQHTTHTPGFSALHPRTVLRTFRECRLLICLLSPNILLHLLFHLRTDYQGHRPEVWLSACGQVWT
jgi:hypothetical protein